MTEPVTIKFHKTETAIFSGKPAKHGDAGLDLAADFGNLNGRARVQLKWGWPPVLVPTGVFIELPEGYEAQIRPRSSMTWAGVHVGFGTIDSAYRGELQVLLAPLGPYIEEYAINHGDRIAQLVISKCSDVNLTEVSLQELSSTERGTGGFGSTGR